MSYDFLKGLNSQQKQAIITTDGPVLVVAGAGSGKTSVLTGRVGYIIQNNHIDPNRILAITFTNKAAEEMKDRISRMINIVPEWVRTYHSTCLKILKEDINNIQDEQRNRNFIVIDEPDKIILIKDIIKQNNIQTKITPKKIVAAISAAKALDIDIENIDHKKLAEMMTFGSLTETQNFAEIFTKYNQALILNNALDFDDLINLAHKLLKENIEIRNKWQNHFDYILVDEFQDTNIRQLEIIKWLVNPKKNNIFVVGDPNQSIYKFRGSYPKVFEDFEQSFNNVTTIKLNINYRSGKNILDCANELINNNSDYWKNDLVHTNPNLNENIVYIARNVWSETDWIIKKIKEQTTLNNVKYGDIAVLYRNNACSRIIEEKLIQEGIPYNLYGGINFWQRAEIKDLVSYIKILFLPNDVACKRIINVPRRSIGQTTIDTIQAWANKNKLTFVETLKKVDEIEELPEASKNKIKNFILEIKNLKKDVLENGISKMLQTIFLNINYTEFLHTTDLNYKDKIDNIKELMKAVEKYFSENAEKTPADFLTEISLYSDTNRKKIKNAINLSTIHAAKGKEWNTVFVYQFNDNLIPSQKCIEEDPDGILEERRVAYVAFTRAKNNLFITCSKEDPYTKKSWGEPATPSRFINEIKNKRTIDNSQPRRRVWEW